MAVVIPEEVLQKLSQVSITARQAVESLLTGMHRSVRRGLSVEFAGHRQYVPGDDLRYLDWLVYARSDRYDIRQYEEETKLRATIVLDTSGSMGYGSAKPTKLDFARSLAAVMGLLMLRQSDSVGLAICDTGLRAQLPPGSTMGHYLNLLEMLAQATPGGETSLGSALQSLAAQLTRRGLVILLSDGFDEAEKFITALQLLRHRKQDVRLFQVIDPAEEELPFHGMMEFVGLEGEPRLKLDADRVRERYSAAFAEHQRRLAEGCHAAGVARELCRTTDDLAALLARAFGEQRHD